MGLQFPSPKLRGQAKGGGKGVQKGQRAKGVAKKLCLFRNDLPHLWGFFLVGSSMVSNPDDGEQFLYFSFSFLLIYLSYHCSCRPQFIFLGL